MRLNYIRRKVAIVGCGPVGMLGALLLQHYGIDYVVIQKSIAPRSHPSAHWLSSNSKAILSQIPHLNYNIDAHQQSFHHFRYYRYVESLFGHQLSSTDHFAPSIQERLAKSKQLTGFTPNHIPQNILLTIMYNSLKIKKNIIFGTQISNITKSYDNHDKIKKYMLWDTRNRNIVQAQNIILCSGSNTNLKSKLPKSIPSFYVQGKTNIMNIINIHFISKNLANKLKEQNRCAMLHFIYGKKIVGILVNHQIQNTGTFVLQIPNYQPFYDLMEVYSARQLINMLFEFDTSSLLSDLHVEHMGKWQVQGILSNSMHKNGIFLAGDAAHAYPPAGGFGMNSGFQDINELIHAIYLVQKNKQINTQYIFNNYSQWRRNVNIKYLKKALQNFKITESQASSIGYSPQYFNYFSQGSFMRTFVKLMPKINPRLLDDLRVKSMKILYSREFFLNQRKLNLFFDQFDLSIQKISKIRKLIMENDNHCGNQSPNFYARADEVSIHDIQKIFGKIQAKNVKFYQKNSPQFENAQKLISSNGNVIIP